MLLSLHALAGFVCEALYAFAHPCPESDGPLPKSSTLTSLLQEERVDSDAFHKRFLASESHSSRKFCMLCLDGGGVRGMYTARILERICEQVPALLSRIDLIAGSSTGSLIGLLLATGYSPSSVVEIYRAVAPKIFQTNVYRRYNPFVSTYCSRQKEALIQQICGDRTMGELGKYILVTAFCVDGIGIGAKRTFFENRMSGWRPALFTNLPGIPDGPQPENDLPVSYVTMCATAAPTYYSIYDGFVDGGVFANNPSMCALARVCATFQSTVRPANAVILSLGTGQRATRIPHKFRSWGVVQWMGWLIDLLFDATEYSIDENVDLLLKGRYCRVTGFLPEPVGLDEADKIDKLLEFADEVDIGPAVEFIRHHMFPPRPTRRMSVPERLVQTDP